MRFKSADLGRSNICIWRPMVAVRTRGSNWLSALPTRRKQVEPGTARTAATAGCKPSPGRQCRQEFFGEFRKTGEISRFNLWRLISCAVRRKQPEPGTARTAATPPNNLRRSAQIRRLRELQSMVPEVADKTGGSASRQRRPVIFGKLPKIRRLRPLQSMAADSRR